LALASLTGGDRSIGIVRLRTKTTDFFLVLLLKHAETWTEHFANISENNVGNHDRAMGALIITGAAKEANIFHPIKQPWA
jgi:hypothetical protein